MLIPMSTGLVQEDGVFIPTVAYVVSQTSESITSIDISNPSALSELDSYTNTKSV